MNDTAASSPVDTELRRLDRRLDELVSAVQQLKEENRALRHRQDNLISERANLLQKTEQVRARVEAMTGRLKAMSMARERRAHDAGQRPRPRQGVPGGLPGRGALRPARLRGIPRRQDAR